MENSTSPNPPTASQATNDLASSTALRSSFVDSLTLPGGHSLLSGVGNAGLAYGVALGNSTWRFGPLAFVVGLTLAAVAQAVALRRFQARNGALVRVTSGFRGPRSTRRVILAFLTVLIAVIVAATWLMVVGEPVLAAVAALAAVPATVIADRAWMARYRLAR